MDQDSPITTLLLTGLVIISGSICVTVAGSWVVATLFCFAAISWGLRLLLQARHRRMKV